MDRSIPFAILNVLIYWYSMCSVVVHWDNTFSNLVQLQCGVRQGGILSPALFALYVNDLILALSRSGHGCYFNNMFVRCVMYADDLLLLSASLCDLQSTINICCEELDKLDMTVNVKKSQLMRIGRLHNKAVHGVVLNGELIECVDELKLSLIHI